MWRHKGTLSARAMAGGNFLIHLVHLFSNFINVRQNTYTLLGDGE